MTDAYWREKAIPELSAAYAWVADLPGRVDVRRRVGRDVGEAWRRMSRCWSIHFWVIRGPYQVVEDLADLYESIVKDASPGEATGLDRRHDHGAPRRGPPDRAIDRHGRREPGRRAIDSASRARPSRTSPSFPEAAPFLDALDLFLGRPRASRPERRRPGARRRGSRSPGSSSPSSPSASSTRPRSTKRRDGRASPPTPTRSPTRRGPRSVTIRRSWRGSSPCSRPRARSGT